MKKKGQTIVIGHKNPDTDSICSAIAYARLKERLLDEKHLAGRAGEMNKETAFVLDRFGMPEPLLITDLRTQVSDIEIKKVPGVSGDISIRTAYGAMKEYNAETLVITTVDGRVEGVITIDDIAAVDLDVYDNEIASKANTPYKNIIETLDGKVLAGSAEGCFSKGKVAIAANTPEMMEEYIREHDLVVIGDRFESQFFALELGVGCIVLCMNGTARSTILKRADECGCVIISSPYDSFTVARLIHQSMPIKYFMSSKNILTFDIDDFTNDVKEVMAKSRHRYFPILGDQGEYLGQISKRSFLDMGRKKVILVDHNEKSQAVEGVGFAEILEIIDHHRLGSLETINPVFFRNQPLGCTATIVYKMYKESNVEIDSEVAGILCGAILSDTLMYRSPTCTEEDRIAAETLGELAGIDPQAFAMEMFEAGSDLKERTSEDIFYQDFKTFNSPGLKFGVGQITSMNQRELDGVRGRISEYMDSMIKKSEMDIIIFMLTNIIEEASGLIFKGAKAKNLLGTTYGEEVGEISGDYLLVEGLVSRKKQLIPELMATLQA